MMGNKNMAAELKLKGLELFGNFQRTKSWSASRFEATLR